MGLPAVAAAEGGDSERAELARALATTKVTLRWALFETAVYAAKGRPISAKFELENGHLQLSVYTERDGAFTEAIIDHMRGTLQRAEPITEGEDLAAAKAQVEAMARAKATLADVVARAENANKGWRAVSVVPALEEGAPLAEVTLVRDQDWKTIREKLD